MGIGVFPVCLGVQRSPRKVIVWLRTPIRHQWERLWGASGVQVRRHVARFLYPDLSPLDLAIAPNGNVVVSSEHPFGAADAVTSVREYDSTDGHLVRIFSSAACLGTTVQFQRLNGQALAFFP
jgi:hypothetical protein